MRVLIVCSEAPPVVSGVARSVGELAIGLRARGHDVDVLSAADAWGVRKDRFRLSGAGLGVLARTKRDGPYDVVNVHGPSPSISDLALLELLFSTQSPAVVYTHHFPMHFGTPVLDQLGNLYDRSMRRLAARCSYVVATSQHYAEHFRKRHRRVAVIPWGTGPALPKGCSRTYDGSQPLRVLAVGQFRKYKGMAVLVSAVLGVESVQLTLVGDGPTISSVRSQVPAGARNVHFAGRVGDSELEDLYWQSDVIALPSTTRAEAFGIVLLEGMAHGCVPVASDLPGVAEVVGTTGRLATPGDHLSLRRVLIDLAEDPDQVEVRKQLGLERVEHYSWGRVVESYEAIFSDVVDRRAARVTR